MNRTKFNAVKYISLLIAMAIYFTISWLLMWFGGVLAEFEVVIRAKAVSVLSLLYCLVFYILLVWLEAIKIGRRRILDLIFGFFFASFCVNVGAAIIYAVFMITVYSCGLRCCCPGFRAVCYRTYMDKSLSSFL